MADEADEFSEHYPEKFLECRLQHDWAIIGYYRANGYVIRASFCKRCGCDRHQKWSLNGTRYSTTYDHPDGYHLKGGVKPWEVRSEVLRRVVIHDSADALTEAVKPRRKK